jgi:hypothetical protein
MLNFQRAGLIDPIYAALDEPLVPRSFPHHHGDSDLRDLARGGVAARRIPGRSAGDPMNSMPAASKAALTSSSVDVRLGGTSSTASKRLIVLAVTPALLANSSVVQRRAFRAERSGGASPAPCPKNSGDHSRGQRRARRPSSSQRPACDIIADSRPQSAKPRSSAIWLAPAVRTAAKQTPIVVIQRRSLREWASSA